MLSLISDDSIFKFYGEEHDMGQLPLRFFPYHTHESDGCRSAILENFAVPVLMGENFKGNKDTGEYGSSCEFPACSMDRGDITWIDGGSRLISQFLEHHW